MVKPRVSSAVAERNLEAAFCALEAELRKQAPAARSGAAVEARRALTESIARLRQAVGKV